MAKLDRVFVSSEWETKVSFATVNPIRRPSSDHVLIKLDSGKLRQKKKRIFRFEKWSLEHEEVYEIIRHSWAQQTNKEDASYNICTKFCRLHRALLRWEGDISGHKICPKTNV